MISMNIKDFIMKTLRAYPNRKISRMDLTCWFVEVMEAPQNFQDFHMRDALYRLEDLGFVGRTKADGDKTFQWHAKA